MTTNNSIKARNRKNAQLSTGPRTEAGKAISRTNATSHGITANPAAFPVEQAEEYQELLGGLRTNLCPVGPIEEMLVGRLATSIHRLRRATEAETALASQRALDARSPIRDQIELIERFHACWRWRDEQETDPSRLKLAYKHALAYRGHPWMRATRRGVADLDDLHARMHENEAGLRALLAILEDLWSHLGGNRTDVIEEEIDKLAFLLGDPARSFPVGLEEFDTGKPLSAIGEKATRRGARYELLKSVRGLPPGAPLPKKVESLLKTLRDTLRSSLHLLDDSWDRNEQKRRQLAAVLLDHESLDRLLRYETNAERALCRALGQLAHMRNVGVSEIAALARGEQPSDTVDSG